MSDAKQWLREAAQRIADHNDGTWCSSSWRIIADAFELVGDDPDGKLDLVAVMFDEITYLRQRLAAAEAATARDRIKLVAWVLRNMDLFGCFSGDCPHDLNSECIQSIIDQYVEDEAAKAKRGRDE